MMDVVRSEGHVIGSKVSAWELEQIRQLVTSGIYLNTSDFVRDAIRDKLAAIKTIKYRDVDMRPPKRKLGDTSRKEEKPILLILRKTLNSITNWYARL